MLTAVKFLSIRHIHPKPTQSSPSRTLKTHAQLLSLSVELLIFYFSPSLSGLASQVLSSLSFESYGASHSLENCMQCFWCGYVILWFDFLNLFLCIFFFLLESSPRLGVFSPPFSAVFADKEVGNQPHSLVVPELVPGCAVSSFSLYLSLSVIELGVYQPCQKQPVHVCENVWPKLFHLSDKSNLFHLSDKSNTFTFKQILFR